MTGKNAGPFLAVLLSTSMASTQAASLAVRDDSGNMVELLRPAERIVTLSPHATELAFAAGAGNRLVGVTAFSNYPAAAGKLPRVGDAARLDRERLLSLAPDLVIAWPSGNRPQDLAWLRRRGIPLFLSEPTALAGIANNLRDIGQLAGSDAAGAAAATRFRDKLERLSKKFSNTPTLRVFYQIWPRPLFTIGKDHIINRVLALCGAENLFDNLPQPAPQISREAVLAANPDAIVAAVETGDEADPFAQWRDWSQLRAVKNQALIRVPTDLMHRATPRILDGAELLCGKLQDLRKF